MSYNFTDKHLQLVKDEPHRLGHMIGFDRLGPLHSDWIKYCWDAEEDRSLQAHRGAYKTTAIDIVGAIRWMLFKPNDRIGLIRKKFDDAAKVLRAIENAMELVELKELFKYAHGFYPELVEANSRRLTYNFKETITPEANVNSFGLTADLIGTHLDKPLCDDFITLKDRISRAEREKTKLIIQDVMANIADKGNWKSTVFVGTPWHKNDAWTCCPEPVRYNVYDTGILSEEEIKEKQTKITPTLFSINYRLINEADENLLFHNPSYGNWIYSIPDVWGHIDAAFDGSATNALTFMSETKTGHQAVGLSYTGNVKTWYDVIEAKYNQYRCRGIYVENNPDKGYVADQLRAIGLNVIDYPEDMDKDTKISIYLYQVWNSLIWAKETDPNYMEQIVDWTRGSKPNDAPDSASSLVRKKFGSKDVYPSSLSIL